MVQPRSGVLSIVCETADILGRGSGCLVASDITSIGDRYEGVKNSGRVHPVRGGMSIEADVIGNLHPARGAMFYTRRQCSRGRTN